MAPRLPTVTIEDLRAFHAKHFPHAPAPEHILHGVELEAEAVENYCEEDEELGYYPDGTKRTLTDEQISMFRHSEIHTIARQRRQRRENGDMFDDNPTPASPSANAATPASLASNPHKDTGVADEIQSGQVEGPKKQTWATTSATTKAKNKRKRNNYAARRKERRLERGLPRRRSGRNGANDNDEDDESDEWDPWHQANGPDVQKDDTLDLDY
ncbi:hypothetical protein BDW02DRAFT_591963 [Decorospora gaudefroyi]|uniref:Uncharacterized protein n=1 Tax=Decorospora gaudefroyi TaxID=184978 RepID=A0A6A5K777_9PLEO|nr:hypothetical protein BDW02DRAFT_591963 [Decorospora gaudefroyi]